VLEIHLHIIEIEKKKKKESTCTIKHMKERLNSALQFSQFSIINPAIIPPLPTPVPSPMRYPDIEPF
jgi:hypothetical protein